MRRDSESHVGRESGVIYESALSYLFSLLNLPGIQSPRLLPWDPQLL